MKYCMLNGKACVLLLETTAVIVSSSLDPLPGRGVITVGI